MDTDENATEQKDPLESSEDNYDEEEGYHNNNKNESKNRFFPLDFS